MKHILTFSLFLFTLSLQAAFTRLATETYPGGGGVATNAVAGITTNGVPVALDAQKIAHLIIPEGGGPTGGVSKAYVDAHDLATLFASTNYTDDATNALDEVHRELLYDVSEALHSELAATNAEIRAALIAIDAAIRADAAVSNAAIRADIGSASQAATNYTDTSTLAATNFVKAGYLPLAGGTITGYLTIGDSVSPLQSPLLNLGATYIQRNDNGDLRFGDENTGIESILKYDDTPVVTSNMLNGVLAPATNATQTALIATNNLLVAAIDNEEDERKTADSKLLTKESTSYPATRNIKWSGYNLVLMGPMLFETWSKIKAGTASSNTELPDYITSRLAAYQTNLVVDVSTADKVLKNDGTTLYWGEGGGGGGGSPLAGAQYNFHNGTNFTWTIYATLTNALVKMGATVANPPALDESTLVHPIVVTASTATGTPLSGKTYDFHGGTNFVKDVYQVLEQAVRDLGATTINTPTF